MTSDAETIGDERAARRAEAEKAVPYDLDAAVAVLGERYARPDFVALNRQPETAGYLLLDALAAIGEPPAGTSVRGLARAVMVGRLLAALSLADPGALARRMAPVDDDASWAAEHRPYGATVADAVALLVGAGALSPQEVTEAAEAIRAIGLPGIAGAAIDGVGAALPIDQAAATAAAAARRATETVESVFADMVAAGHVVDLGDGSFRETVAGRAARLARAEGDRTA